MMSLWMKKRENHEGEKDQYTGIHCIKDVQLKGSQIPDIGENALNLVTASPDRPSLECQVK